MSEIKTVLNFFDKNNGLKAVLKDLKSIKKLQAEINNQKGGVSSDNLKERTAALKEITRLQKQLDAQRKKAINTGKQAVGIEKELVKVQEQDRKVKKQLKVARTEKFRQLQENKLAQQKQTKAVKAEIIENSKLSTEYERQSAKLNRLRKNLKNLILTEGEGSAKTKKLAFPALVADCELSTAMRLRSELCRVVSQLREISLCTHYSASILLLYCQNIGVSHLQVSQNRRKLAIWGTDLETQERFLHNTFL